MIEEAYVKNINSSLLGISLIVLLALTQEGKVECLTFNLQTLPAATCATEQSSYYDVDLKTVFRGVSAQNIKYVAAKSEFLLRCLVCS